MARLGRLFGWDGAQWVAIKLSAAGRMIIDQTIGGVGGATAWLAQTTVGIAQTLRFNMTALFTHTVGVALDATRNTLRVAQTPALSVAIPVVTGTTQPAQTPAFVIGARISDFKLPQVPAAEMVQVVYNLTRTVGGNAQAAFGNPWTNPGNAINGTDGIHNGSPYATSAGSALGGTFGIDLNYANVVNKSVLTITSVTLNFYMAGVDATGLLLDTELSYWNDAIGWVLLEPAIAGAFSNLTVPRSYTLPLTTWAEIDALQARAVCAFAAASVAANASLDAIEVVIVANLTDTLT